MLESRVIKRCYPRFSVPSHLYARNAYDFFAFLPLFLPSSPFFQPRLPQARRLTVKPIVLRERKIYRKKNKKRRDREREREKESRFSLTVLYIYRGGRAREERIRYDDKLHDKGITKN